ncbi:MAG: DUF4159 domain-containing protein [Alphaproteobacteria bacterium]|nr:DUF4159 domain-containing protein [Alphaproteobacteria bacterium]
MSLLGGLTFSYPWLLAALAALPAIWFLLRVTPPAPRRVPFPPLRLLLGLDAPEETPARTPWWLLLLRIIAAAFIIIALAAPVIGENKAPVTNGPLVLFIDNGWTAAHNWDDRQSLIEETLDAAARAERPVALVATADPQTTIDLLDAGKAERIARELAPRSWLPDRKGALAALAKTKFAGKPEIVWLSDDVDHGDAIATSEALAKIGSLTVYRDARGKGPLALEPEDATASGYTVPVLRGDSEGARDGLVEAIGARGERLGGGEFHFLPGKSEADAKIGVPPEVRNQIRKLTISNEHAAGATRLLGADARHKEVGLVSAINVESEQPLLSDLYYLERALGPFADLHKGTIEDALTRKVSVLLLADIGRIAGADYDRVEKFVREGGVLIRFAGPRMTENTDDLVPVKLRNGGRYLGGAMAWAEPQHLAPFPDASPFRGLTVPEEVTVSRQILAEPSVELSERSWARLSDGTPLVTAAQRGKGWVVLFHVTAGPGWSSLPLSGLYVDMLRRLMDLSSGVRPAELARDADASFAPLSVLDGFGEMHKPSADILPIRGGELVRATPSAKHPAGLYGAEGAEIAFNAANRDTLLTPLPELRAIMQTYAGATTIALQSPLLVIAILLLLADAVLSLWLRGLLVVPRLPRGLGRTAGLFLIALVLMPQHSRADDAFDMKAALDTRLAYVITGVSDVDDMSRAGLTGLGLILKTRTSYLPEAPLGIDLDRDDLSFFPLIYWPMDPRQKELSPQAISKLSDYMRNGGTLLIDTRDRTLGGEPNNSPGTQTLRRLLGKLDLPPLQPVPADHVLTKTFYLLQTFPGRWEGGKVWVEALPPAEPGAAPSPARGGDGVSPVIIGGNDWASAWAVDNTGQPIAAVSSGSTMQREMAYRFGVNVVMYALTGNYKTDQVHVPALLQRLGKEK